MSKSKFAIIIDSIFLSFSVSIIIYVWLGFYIKNAILINFLSIFAFLSVFILFFYFQQKNYKNLKLSFADKKLSEKCLSFFLFSSDEDYNDFIQKLLIAKHLNGFIFENTNNLFYVNLKWSLSARDFIEANNFKVSSKSQKELIFICFEQGSDFSNLNKLSPITYKVFLFESLFKIMKHKNTFPISYEYKSKTKKEKLLIRKNNFLESISKHKFKEFFFSGLSLLILSIFLPFSFYYLIFGTILLILSVVCIFAKNKNYTNQNASLDDYLK